MSEKVGELENRVEKALGWLESEAPELTQYERIRLAVMSLRGQSGPLRLEVSDADQ